MKKEYSFECLHRNPKSNCLLINMQTGESVRCNDCEQEYISKIERERDMIVRTEGGGLERAR